MPQWYTHNFPFYLFSEILERYKKVWRGVLKLIWHRLGSHQRSQWNVPDWKVLICRPSHFMRVVHACVCFLCVTPAPKYIREPACLLVHSKYRLRSSGCLNWKDTISVLVFLQTNPCWNKINVIMETKPQVEECPSALFEHFSHSLLLITEAVMWSVLFVCKES